MVLNERSNMYFIIGGDGKEYGPVSIDQLRQWLAEGRVSAQTQVRADGSSTWQSFGAIPELAVLTNVPPTISTPMAPTAASPHAGIHEGDYELDIFGCVNRAWNILTSNFWMLLGGCAVYLLIIGGLSGFAQIPFIGMLFSIASLIVTGPLIGGVYIFLLRAMRNQPADISNVFSGFTDNLGQLILGHIIPTLIAGAVAIPGAIVAAIPIIIMAENEAANAGLIAIAVFGFLLAIIPAIYISVCWTFTIPLIADRRMDFWPAMKASRAQVSRHWWTVFGLFIVAGLINLLGVIACCVGLFVTTPLVFLAMMVAYETIFTSRTYQPGPGA